MKKSALYYIYLFLGIFALASCYKSPSSPYSPDVDASHPLDKGLPKKNYSYPSTAYKVTSALPSGYKKDGSVNYTEYIQKAIDENKEVVFPDFPVLIGKPGLRVESGKKIYFQENSKIVMEPTGSTNYYMILLLDAENVTLKNIYLEGDRNKHLGSGGEWGMGIYISGSKNILIESATITNCWGDGIYLGQDSWNKPSENIHIKNCLIDSNRRSGISIISGNHVTIEQCIIQNTNGPLISSGITLEANNRNNEINNINIINTLTKNNQKVGLRFALTNLIGSGGDLKDCNVNVKDYKDQGSQYGITFVLGSPTRKGGMKDSRINLKNCLLIDNAGHALENYTPKDANVYHDVFMEEVIPVLHGRFSDLEYNRILSLTQNTDYFHLVEK